MIDVTLLDKLFAVERRGQAARLRRRMEGMTLSHHKWTLSLAEAPPAPARSDNQMTLAVGDDKNPHPMSRLIDDVLRPHIERGLAELRAKLEAIVEGGTP